MEREGVGDAERREEGRNRVLEERREVCEREETGSADGVSQQVRLARFTLRLGLNGLVVKVRERARSAERQREDHRGQRAGTVEGLLVWTDHSMLQTTSGRDPTELPWLCAEPTGGGPTSSLTAVTTSVPPAPPEPSRTLADPLAWGATPVVSENGRKSCRPRPSVRMGSGKRSELRM